MSVCPVSTARPEPEQPLPARQGVIDAARGLAVLGVGWCNAPAMAGLPGGPGDVPDLTTVGERWLWAAGQVLWQGRLVALLSLLFGASMVWIGGDPRQSACLDRRLGWLAVIGVLHGALLWWGDILLPYALAGLALRPCRGWSARRLLVLGVVAYALGVVVLRVDDALALWQHGMGRGQVPAPAYGWPGNARIWLADLPESVIGVLLTSGPMMAVGMAMARRGWLTGAWLRRHARWLLMLGLGAVLVSLPLALLRAGLWGPQQVWAPGAIRFWMISLSLVTAPAGALGWLGVAAMMRRQEVLAAAGRVALSIYLAQSLALRVGLVPVAYGGVMAFTAVVLGCQILLAWMWRKSGRHGPAEALWRGLYRGDVGFGAWAGRRL